MTLTLDLKRAAEKAEASRFDIQIRVQPEGVTIIAVNGDRESVQVLHWADLDRSMIFDVTRAVERAIAALDADLDNIIQTSTGVRPIKPRPYLP